MNGQLGVGSVSSRTTPYATSLNTKEAPSLVSLDFGSVVIGRTSTLNMEVLNNSSAVLPEPVLSLSHAVFGAVAGCNSVPANGSCSIGVSFSPLDGTPVNGSLTIDGRTVSLSGTGVTATPTFTPSMTPTLTSTPTQTPTNTPTLAPVVSETPVPTATAIPTASAPFELTVTPTPPSEAPVTIILSQVGRRRGGKAKLVVETYRLDGNSYRSPSNIENVNLTCFIKDNANQIQIGTGQTGKTEKTPPGVTRGTNCRARAKLWRPNIREIAQSNILKLK